MTTDKWWTILAKFLALPAVRALLIWYAKRYPYFHLVGEDGSVYMERYWLFNRDIDWKGTKRFPHIRFSIRVHKILRADLDRWYHNHPGRFRTFILQNWYNEQRPMGFMSEAMGQLDDPVFHRPQGSTTTLDEDEYHSVVAVHPEGVWTLFVMWEPVYRKPGSWGFLVEGKYVPWRQYLRSKEHA
jgi:hypothetical protein